MDGSQVNKLEAFFSTEVSLTEGSLDDAIEKYFELVGQMDYQWSRQHKIRFWNL